MAIVSDEIMEDENTTPAAMILAFRSITDLYRTLIVENCIPLVPYAINYDVVIGKYTIFVCNHIYVQILALNVYDFGTWVEIK